MSSLEVNSEEFPSEQNLNLNLDEDEENDQMDEGNSRDKFIEYLYTILTSDVTQTLLNPYFLSLLTLSIVSIVTSICLWSSVSNSYYELLEMQKIFRLNMTKVEEELTYQLDNRLAFWNTKFMEQSEAMELKMTYDLRNKMDNLWTLFEDHFRELQKNFTMMEQLFETRQQSLILNNSINLSQTILLIKKTIEADLKSQLINFKSSVRNEIVPVGFVYVQHKNQFEPTIMWPFEEFKWIEISTFMNDFNSTFWNETLQENFDLYNNSDLNQKFETTLPEDEDNLIDVEIKSTNSIRFWKRVA